LSSTTDRRRDESGQILVLFAGAIVLILAGAALVFDVGQNLLDRRTEQNVSDAAALAGAQYAQGAPPFHGFCAAAPGGNQAVPGRVPVAAESGYVDGTDGRHVRVDVPPVFPSTFAGIPNHVQVTISSERPSFFAGVLGMANQNVWSGRRGENRWRCRASVLSARARPARLRDEQDQRGPGHDRVHERHGPRRLRLLA
jgi:uncharacterized membrane protein